MKEKEYIMIGTPEVSKDFFRTILRPFDNYSYKPNGGFWATEFLSEIGTISSWYNYLLSEPSVAFQKDIHSGVIFTLKEDANVLTINNYDQIVDLASKYPSYHHILNSRYNNEMSKMFDYEKLANVYDGVYIDYYKLISSCKTRFFDYFDVPSLLLFNLDCIKEYKSVDIVVDLDSYMSIPYINNSSNSKVINNSSQEYQKLYDRQKQIFLDLMGNYKKEAFNDYDHFLTIVCKNIKKSVDLGCNNKNSVIIDEKLKDLGVRADRKLITRNAVLNYLKEYYQEEEENIKKLSKSYVKYGKRYVID